VLQLKYIKKKTKSTFRGLKLELCFNNYPMYDVLHLLIPRVYKSKYFPVTNRFVLGTFGDLLSNL
jgi:hypothetical protein